MLKAYGLTPIGFDWPIKSSGPNIYIYDVKKDEIKIFLFCVWESLPPLKGEELIVTPLEDFS